MQATQTSYILRDKVEAFISDLYIALRRYPKSERHVLAAETRQAAYRLLRNVITASKVERKAAALNAADTELALVNAMMRIGMQLQYLSFPSYERLCRQTVEVGKILGGWLKKQ